MKRTIERYTLTVAREHRSQGSVLTAVSFCLCLCLSWVSITFAAKPAAALENNPDGQSVEMPLTNVAERQCVVVLHGLARTSRAMRPIARAFENAGYTVVNVDYPSRHHPIEYLALLAVEKLGVSQCGDHESVHFVTHSLGGILVRYYLAHNEIPADLPKLGRVVMLAPPNKGSEVVDNYKNIPGFRFLNGPAGMQLGTDEQSVPSQLPAVNFDLGVIAGSKTFNPILSLHLPNPDDGKVSAESARVEGMSDYMLLPVTHTFLMRSDKVIDQAIHYIENGSFKRDGDS